MSVRVYVTPPQGSRAKRVPWIENGVGCIPLSNGTVALVDPDDLYLLSFWTWSASNPKGYAVANVGGKVLYLHHMLLPKRDGCEVDHANRNHLDNRRANLRYATRIQQAANCTRQGRSPYRGVRQRVRSWAMAMNARYVGGFPTAEAAAREYDRVARELYGEFAVLNFPDEWPARAAEVAESDRTAA